MKISSLQKARYEYSPKLPAMLRNGIANICVKDGEETQSVADQEKIKALFPNTYGKKEITFEQGGHCTQVYGEEVLTGDEQQTWTKGFVLRKWNSTACAYQIHEIAGREYLIIEWKSGDYRSGGRPTSYYAFIRA